jgi:hypothetical protein
MFLNRIKIEWAIIFIGAVALFPFLVLCFYNHPTTDDFPFTNIAKQYGYFGAHLYWYKSAAGTFLPTLQMSTNPLIIDWFWGYKIIPFIFIFIFIFSIYYLIHTLTTPILAYYQKLAITFSILFIFLYHIPRIAHLFYWLTGITTYLTPTILTLIFLAILCKIKMQVTYNYWLIVLLVFILLLILNGCETYFVLTIGLISLLAFTSLMLYKKTDKLFTLLLIFIVLGAIPVLLSPGIHNRATSEYSSSCGFFQHLIMALEAVFWEIFNYTYSKTMPIVLFSIILFPILNQALAPNNFFDRKPFPILNPLIALFVTFFFPAIIIAPICWLAGSTVFRVANIAYFYFVLGFLYSIYCLLVYFKNKYSINVEKHIYKRIQWLLLTVLTLSLIQPNNIRAAYADIFLGRASQYNKETNNRYRCIKACNSDTCMIPPIYARPASLWDADMTSNPSHWINRSYAIYFNKKNIAIDLSKK